MHHPYRGRNEFPTGGGTARQLHVGLPFRCHDRAGTRPHAHAPRKPIQTHTRANAVTRPRNGCTQLRKRRVRNCVGYADVWRGAA